MSMREQIADVILGCVAGEYDEDRAADAIIAALPSMIPDLEWEGLISNPYFIQMNSRGEVADLFYGDELIKGQAWDSVDIDALKAAANTHNRNAILKAMRVEV